jgi:hypothetical protein
MDDRQKTAFEFVADYSKQLITLATGVVTFMVTFLQDELRTGTDGSRKLLVWSWGLFVVSILAGIWRLMALTGNLDPSKPGASPVLKITTLNVRFPGIIQILSFLAAISLSCVFGSGQIFEAKRKDPDEKTIIILRQQVDAAGKTISADTIYPAADQTKSEK